MDRNEPKTSPCERDANARLIAAAPALLAQLQALAVQLESCGMIVPPGVTQAIAQATGNRTKESLRLEAMVKVCRALTGE